MAQPDPSQFGENPLVPDAVLRQLLTTMQRLRRGRRGPSHTSGDALSGESCPSGQEAIYAASLISLRDSDLICGDAFQPKWLSPEGSPMWLDVKDTATDARLLLALGAASALRSQAKGGLVLAYTASDELKPREWQRLLGIAGARALPIILIALPGRQPGWISGRAQGWGVPGMPVDTLDPVALYRVLQESALRARHGDGPALLEPISWTGGGSIDPVSALQQVLAWRSRRSSSQQHPATPLHADRTQGK